MTLEGSNRSRSTATTAAHLSSHSAFVLAPEPVESKAPDGKEKIHNFRADLKFYLAFISLSVIALAAALDATSLSVALPVRINLSFTSTPS
jgi:hypothetical protein